MKGLTNLSAVLFMTILLVGCSNQKTPTSLNEDTSIGPVTFGGGPPANSGLFVMRFEDFVAIWYPDLKSGMSITHGVDNVAFCNGVIDFDLVELQLINVPEDAARLISLINAGDVTTSVWPFTVFDCALFTTIAPLATGTAHLIATDNDLLSGDPDSKNSNAFGFAAHGTLTRPNGEKAQLSAHNKAVWDGNDLSTMKSTVKINLR